MLSEYGFGKIENQNCFEDGVTDILYFPIIDSDGCPCEIIAKAAELIEEILDNYKAVEEYRLNTSELCLNARLVCFMENYEICRNEIVVVVSGDIWMEKTYVVNSDSILYESFKRYFMEQMERKLFEKYSF